MTRLGRLHRFLGLGVGSPAALRAYGGAVLAAMCACLLAIGASLLAVLFAPAPVSTMAITPSGLFLTAVIGSAWRGGLGPGLVSAFVSLVLVGYFFHRPLFALTLTSETLRTEMGLFVLATLLTCLCRATLPRGGH
jgi:K+-sensing histidine kinase KdpD